MNIRLSMQTLIWTHDTGKWKFQLEGLIRKCLFLKIVLSKSNWMKTLRVFSNTKYCKTNLIVGIICLVSAIWLKIESAVVTFTSATQMIQGGCTQWRSTNEIWNMRLPNWFDLQSNDSEPKWLIAKNTRKITPAITLITLSIMVLWRKK